MHGGGTHSRRYRQRSDCLARRPIKENGQIGPKRGCQPVQRFQRGICRPDLNRADERLPKTGFGPRGHPATAPVRVSAAANCGPESVWPIKLPASPFIRMNHPDDNLATRYSV